MAIKPIEKDKLISFRKSVLTLFMLASFFPAFLAGLPFVSRILDLEEKNAETRLSYLAQSAGDRVDSTLEVLISKIDALTHDQDIALISKSMKANGTIRGKFKEFLNSNPLATAIYFVGMKGGLVAASPPSLMTQQHLPFLSLVQRNLKERGAPLSGTFVSWDERFAEEHWHLLNKTNENASYAFLFKIRYFINVHGNVSGAVVVAVPTQRLSPVVSRAIGARVRARILAQNGPIVTVPYHAGDLQESYTRNETLNEVGDEIDSSTTILLNKGSSPIPLTLTVWEPVAQHKEPIIESAIWVAGLLVIIVLFFGYVGYLVALWLLRPMEVLSTKVKDYSKGEYDTEHSKVDFVEFNDFLNLLQSMAQQIEEQIEEVAERRKRETYLEKERIQAELSALRLQMNPHFLFNALNNVAAVMSNDPKLAQQMLEKLSALYHKILSASKHLTIPLSSEISLVRDYIYLQKTRFGDRLQYQERVPDNLDHLEIPGLLLQTLVENAVKHGIEKARRGGLIELQVVECENGLSIKVINTGRAYVENINPTGFGLVNTKKRLQSIYGEMFSFDLGSDENQRTVVSIWIGKKVMH